MLIKTELEYALIQKVQAITGVKVDVELLDKHLKTLKERQKSLVENHKETLGYYIQPGSCVSKPFRKDGTPSFHTKTYCSKAGIPLEQVSGPFSRVSIEPLEPSKRQKLCDRLISLGWKPKEYTETGQPKLTSQGVVCQSLSESSSEAVRAIGKVLGEYYIIQHRYGLLKGIKEALREDGRVPALMNTCGTNTYRVTHKIVANIPKASDKVYFGKECREIFTADLAKGYLMLGFDASGLEARTMAHYTMPFDDGAFAKLILEEDIHTYTQEALGLETRDLAKGLRYALTYGAQAGKVRSLLGCSQREAEQIFNDFWESTPGLAKLRYKVIRTYETKGYLPGLDGGIVRPRSSHSALNTLFQSAGAKIMKKAQILLIQKALEEGVVFKKVIDYHDEGQFEVLKSDCVFLKADKEAQWPYALESSCKLHIDEKDYLGYHRLGEIALESLRASGELLRVRVPITGEYMIGRNWKETH